MCLGQVLKPISMFLDKKMLRYKHDKLVLWLPTKKRSECGRTSFLFERIMSMAAQIYVGAKL